jgi:anti-sigma factor ChrR (cupin superfamily)
MATTNEPSLDRWDIRHGTGVERTPWGPSNEARVKVLGAADGYTVALIEAPAGYRSPAHEHSHAEFFYLLEGTIRNQGQTLTGGDGYAAAPALRTPTSRPKPPPPICLSSVSEL